MDGELLLAPGFTSPPNSDYMGYHQYIDDYLPEETPYLYGLHPNAEIGYLTTVSERLFKVSTLILWLQFQSIGFIEVNFVLGLMCRLFSKCNLETLGRRLVEVPQKKKQYVI